MLLEIDALYKSFVSGGRRTEVLRGVSLTLEAGTSLALCGDSGSGKSTLLHLIAGLDTADAGHVRIEGTDPATLGEAGRAALRRGRIGLVFQQFNLIPSLSVGDNIAFQARLARRDDPDWIARLSDRLGLAKLSDRYPEALSGGQQQRVALGRALAPRPALLLADEPTGNLDPETGDAALALMQDLAADSGAGLLIVTHSDRIAGALDRRIRLEHGRIAP